MVILLVLVNAIVVLLLAATYGVPNVLACTETEVPATAVEVTSNRMQGHIVERYALGCTRYFHEGRFGD